MSHAIITTLSVLEEHMDMTTARTPLFLHRITQFILSPEYFTIPPSTWNMSSKTICFGSSPTHPGVGQQHFGRDIGDDISSCPTLTELYM
jgi:hypothetical protein